MNLNIFVMNSEDLIQKIVKSVENNLPRFSGINKIFLVLLNIENIQIKIVFWRPRNYTLVAHNHEVPKSEDSEMFLITSYHDSCWRYDGFSFLNKFSRTQKENIQILSTEIIELKECSIDSSEKFFSIK